MVMPVIDICPLREPFEPKPKTSNRSFLGALRLRMEVPEPRNADRIGVQALVGIFAQLPFACDLNLHLRDGRVVSLQWLPDAPVNKPV